VLLISGYPEGVLMLDTGWIFLQKPFQADAILAKIRQVLDSAPSAYTFSG
jgi:hypothetical protein